MEFVKADKPKALRHFGAQYLQGVRHALQLAQFAMHFAHELMKVQPRFEGDRHRFVKAIHQKTLAAPHATIHVHTLRNGRALHQPTKEAGALLFKFGPFARAALQSLYGVQLLRITLKTACGNLSVINLCNR